MDLAMIVKGHYGYAVDWKNISLPLYFSLIFNYKIKRLDFFMVMYFITNSNPISKLRRAAPAICDRGHHHCLR